MRTILRPGTMDVARNVRRPATQSDTSYITINTLPGLTVGTNRIRLTARRIPCYLTLLQATITNAGIIFVGGANVDAGSGLELDGGRGVLFSTAASPTNMQQMLTGTGMGMGYPGPLDVGGMPSHVGRVRRRQAFLLLDLYDIWVVANAVNQTLRVMYILPPQ